MILLLFEKMCGLGILAVLGYIFIRWNKIKDSDLSFISWLVIDVTMPALFFVQVMNGGFSLENKGLLLSFGAGVVIPFMAYFLSFPLFAKIPLKNKEISSLRFDACVGNSSFLPLPLAMALWGDAGVSSCLAFVLGSNIFLFSVGIGVMESSENEKKHSISMVFRHPQALAFGAGVLLFSLGLRPPAWILDPIDLLGKATIPLAMLVTGAILGRERIEIAGRMQGLLRMLLLKLILLPALVFLILKPFKNNDIVEISGALILLEAAMPSLASAAAYARRFGGDAGIAAAGTLLSTFACLLTVPIWMGLWN